MARGRGLDVEIAHLEQSGLPERSYDVVSAFHVLEHVPDSQAFLQTLSRWVRPGGFITIEVPNFKSVQRRRLRENWPGLRPHEHLVHFTPETLRRTMHAAGVQPVLTRSPAYVGPPQNLDHALNDLVRQGRFRRLVEPLSPVRVVNGLEARYPTRAGWAVLHAMEAIYDRAGVGAVVFCIGRGRLVEHARAAAGLPRVPGLRGLRRPRAGMGRRQRFKRRLGTGGARARAVGARDRGAAQSRIRPRG
jgi:SAM-dependent methyltransferase